MNLVRSVPFPDKTKHMTTDVISGWLSPVNAILEGSVATGLMESGVDSTAHEYAPPEEW